MTRQPGGSLGKVLAQLLGETFIHAHAATVRDGQAARIEATSAFMEHMETELAPILDRVLADYIDRPDLPDGLRALMEAMTSPTHQFDVLLQIVGAISAMLAGIFGLGAPMIQPLLNQLWSENRLRELPPDLAADGVERGRWTQEYADYYASVAGLDPNAFTDMIALVGEPPGLEEMLSLIRRGILDEDTFVQMVEYSRVRNEWIPYVQALIYSSMTPGDALEAGLKGVVSFEESQAYFIEGGGLADQYETLLATTGDAIGVEAALNLLNHGLIDLADAEQVILHSRINPQFEAMALLLRNHWLAPYQIVEALTAGHVTPEEAAEWLLQDGYPVEQVAALTGTGTSLKVAAAKALTESQLAQLYETGLVSESAAVASLEQLGYDESEAELLLALYEEKRELSMANAAVSQVRKIFLAGRIDATTATSSLASLGIDAAAITQYLNVWTIEAASELKSLTPAQVGAMVKAGYITTDDATTRWTTEGYDATDAGLLLAYYTGVAPAGSPAAATAATSAATTGTTAS